jgi:hypothetical protein
MQEPQICYSEGKKTRVQAAPAVLAGMFVMTEKPEVLADAAVPLANADEAARVPLSVADARDELDSWADVAERVAETLPDAADALPDTAVEPAAALSVTVTKWVAVCVGAAGSVTVRVTVTSASLSSVAVLDAARVPVAVADAAVRLARSVVAEAADLVPETEAGVMVPDAEDRDLVPDAETEDFAADADADDTVPEADAETEVPVPVPVPAGMVAIVEKPVAVAVAETEIVDLTELDDAERELVVAAWESDVAEADALMWLAEADPLGDTLLLPTTDAAENASPAAEKYVPAISAVVQVTLYALLSALGSATHAVPAGHAA